MKTAETATTRYKLRDDGILTALEINPELQRTEEMVTEALDAAEILTGGEPCPSLWDPRPLIKAYPPGWIQLVNRLEKLVTSLAIVVDGATPGVQGLLPSLTQALLVPVRVFEDEAEALQWLRSQRV